MDRNDRGYGYGDPDRTARLAFRLKRLRRMSRRLTYRAPSQSQQISHVIRSVPADVNARRPAASHTARPTPSPPERRFKLAPFLHVGRSRNRATDEPALGRASDDNLTETAT
ncbi:MULTISPECIES: hypothetical protein [unclassified Burkholderia]|uniref:hypothetical protein n=1 Tax=unclassified Burkholderia TaxID=2613784 RepID=UPI002AB04847|nr:MULTISPECIES: hypothetical protein [unclassified Burkholderia]